jgi:hypothetical protein
MDAVTPRRTALAVALASLSLAGVAALAGGSGTEPDPLRAAVLRVEDARADEVRPLRGSVRIEARMADPDGAAPWAVRTWITRDRRMACAQVGRLAGGRFGAMRVDGRFEQLQFAEGARCGTPTAADGPPFAIETFVDDPLGREPRPVRTVVWGLAGPRARRVSVTAPDAARALRLSRRGAFLSLHRGEVRTYEVTLRITGARGRVRTISYGRARREQDVPRNVSLEARAPAPGGGPDVGMLVWETADGSLCTTTGETIAGDRVGVLPARGTFFDYPVGEGGACGPRPGADRPLRWSFSTRLDAPATLEAIAGPEVERLRVEGIGEPREVTPSERGAMLVVLDAPVEGEIVLTARMRDGSTHVERFDVGIPRERTGRARLSYSGPRTLPVTPGGIAVVSVDCARSIRGARRCLGHLRLGARRKPASLGTVRELHLASRLVRIGSGTRGRPLRVRISRRGRALLRREGRLPATLTLMTDHAPRSRSYDVTLVPGGRAAARSRVRIRPATGDPDKTFLLRFPLLYPMEEPLDAYEVRVHGPGERDCKGRLTARMGSSWHPRYNARHRRNGVRYALTPTRGEREHPPSRDPRPPDVAPREAGWCPGSYRVTVAFRDGEVRRAVGEARFRVR